MIQIDIRQTRTVVGDDAYRVKTETTYVSGIIPEIFVHRTMDDAYQHVATVNDVTSLPRTKQDAVDQQVSSYLASVAEVDYSDVATALYAAAYTQGRVRELCENYASYSLDFEGQDDYSYSSDGEEA